MPKPISLATLLLLITFAAGPIAAQTTPEDVKLERVQALLTAAYPADGPGAAVLVARGRDVLLESAYGMANMELDVPMRPEHVLRIGSVTKQFTAVAVLLLVEDGLVSLDDEITRFFPDWPTHGHRITVEHLLSHTSGIRSHTFMPVFEDQVRRDLTLDELIASARDEPMDFAPGEEWRYNNSAYLVLGAIIERMSGATYEEFLQQRLFGPLGMTNTAYGHNDIVLPGRVPGYAVTHDRRIRNADFLSMNVPHAAGALVSTVADMFIWHRALVEGRVLSAATRDRAFSPGPLNDGRSSGYGFGWFAGRAAGQITVEHGGDIHGFAAEALWLPDDDLYIVVLSNAQRNFANPATLAGRIAEIMLDVEARPAVTLTPEALDAYTGVYRISETEERFVYREGGTLYSLRGAGTPQELRPVGNDLFDYATGAWAHFRRDNDGQVTTMHVSPRIGPEQLPGFKTDQDVAEAVEALRTPVEVPVEVLDAYAGEYEVTPDIILAIRRSGDGLEVQAPGQPAFTLIPRSESRFDIDQVPATIEFQREGTAVTGLILYQGGRETPATRR